jgi:hypothetical protein
MTDEWRKELERLDEQAAKRRVQVKELDQEGQELIQEAEERRDRDKPAE